MDLSQNIKRLRKEHNYTQRDLAKILRVKPTSVSAWESGRNKPLMDKITIMASLFNVSTSELVGDTFEKADILPIYNQLEKKRQQKVYDFASDQLAEQNNPHKNNITKFPNRNDDEQSDYDIYSDIKIYGAASAGPGEVLMDEHTETVTYHGFVPKHDYALVVNGNSMEPLFADQQVIFVDKTEEAYNGQIVIAFLNGNAYVKKLWISSDKCELVSLNPDYAPIEITENDDFCIDGVVVL